MALGEWNQDPSPGLPAPVLPTTIPLPSPEAWGASPVSGGLPPTGCRIPGLLVTCWLDETASEHTLVIPSQLLPLSQAVMLL